MPTDKNLTDDAHKIATDAIEAARALGQAAVNVPADVAKLALDTLQATVDKLKDVVRTASK